MRRSPARHQPYAPQPYYPQPEPRGGIIATISTVIMALAALVTVGLFAWKITGGVLPSMPTLPSSLAVRTAIPNSWSSGRSEAPPDTAAQDGIASYNATEVARVAQPPAEQPAAAQPAVQPAIAPNVNDPATWPTAAIVVPTVPANVQVIPRGVPQFVSSGPATTAPAPTLAIPTPLTTVDYTVSADGKCVIAPRDGKRYQVCQDWKYAPHEVASVAGYIRGGVLPGVEVR